VFDLASKIINLENELLSLNPNERARIALKLLNSLDDDEGNKDEIDAIWIEEVKSRYIRYTQGKTTIKPAEQVFFEARSRKL